MHCLGNSLSKSPSAVGDFRFRAEPENSPAFGRRLRFSDAAPEPGGFLNVHADFNKYEAYNLDRRVNTFVYMNEDWPDEYGGHLELWSKDMKSCHQKILPTFGRFVVFSSTDFSYHGHPQALAAPSDRQRRSLALYYYTNGRPAGECRDGDCSAEHSTLFQTPRGCKVCDEQTCKRYDENKPVWVVAN
ncbi:hypothetical protein THAOC_13837 [Thalassiosira oceanica]|uniref:Prolyl 4-hydroxylase alpha subunit Fe(2+) 2OG dioxygenase domain-containing protein n=1 Tax=Thalassiosira oceanica TaxID=159749 RepID=K0SJ09_THAOC|nr:hypothetical protein THAOC_13837 [Thalassiosira oceanica]|eukprot:EJK65315.1 hypothetical protein THAOC_13837 [Thalassiosira oceanica]